MLEKRRLDKFIDRSFAGCFVLMFSCSNVLMRESEGGRAGNREKRRKEEETEKYGLTIYLTIQYRKGE